jgi:hypothetical protein
MACVEEDSLCSPGSYLINNYFDAINITRKYGQYLCKKEKRAIKIAAGQLDLTVSQSMRCKANKAAPSTFGDEESLLERA